MLQVLETDWVDPEVEVAYRLEELRQHIDQMELAFAVLAAELEKGVLWDKEGFNSAGDWLRFTCHMNSHAVSNALAVGGQEAKLAKSVEAMRAGEIGFAHLATMGRTADELGKGFDESTLLPLALKHSPGKFHDKILHYKHSVDAAGYNREQERLVEERSLRLSTAQDGCLLIMGVLDPVGGAAVRTALEPLAQPSGAHDDRSREQRLADALVERVAGGTPGNLQLTATIETLKGLAGAAAGEMEFSLPISSTAIQRLACDCSVTRVLLSQESLTIDVGRSKRVISGGLSRALKARDGHCRWPGCERSASMCDGHHLVRWMVHEGGWQVIQTNEQKLITVAPTITFGLPTPPHSWGGGGAAAGGAPN